MRGRGAVRAGGRGGWGRLRRDGYTLLKEGGMKRVSQGEESVRVMILDVDDPSDAVKGVMLVDARDRLKDYEEGS